MSGKSLILLICFFINVFRLYSQGNTEPDFTWGNSAYFNIDVGEAIVYNNTQIKLIRIENHFNRLVIGNDTVNLKVSRRTLPFMVGNVRIFVADNKNMKAISKNKNVHELLKKDALICVSQLQELMLDRNQFVFPVNFIHGYIWSAEEDRYLFSLARNEEEKIPAIRENTGIDFDLHETRGIEKNWIVAVENSTVVWINEDKTNKNESSVLLQSRSNSEIFYVYHHLYSKSIEVKKGQELEKGELLGTAWGDKNWGHLTLTVVKSSAVPTPENSNINVLNGFPQLFELYAQNSLGISRNYRKGRFFFGKPVPQHGNQKNALCFEEYAGKGWLLGTWNIAERVETVSKGTEGNVRLRKAVFSDTELKSVNPRNWFDYEIQVPQGTYRIRARIGDVELPSWQKIAFEKIDMGTIATERGQFVWTSERVVKVTDGRLTVRIYIDETNEKVAGISEIVFQIAE